MSSRREAKAQKELERQASRAPPVGPSGRALGGRGPGGRGLGGRGPAGSGLISSRQSIRPSHKGFGADGGGRRLPGSGDSANKVLGVGVNEALINRRKLIAVEPDEDDESDDESFWEEEEGAVSFCYFSCSYSRVRIRVVVFACSYSCSCSCSCSFTASSCFHVV